MRNKLQTVTETDKNRALLKNKCIYFMPHVRTRDWRKKSSTFNYKMR